MEIVNAFDGSYDATTQLVRSLTQSEGKGRVRFLEFPVNRGKIHCLNDAVPQLRGEIVVFSDASSMLASDSVRNLVASFADPRVGAASGVYQVLNHDASATGHQEDFYWKYETFLKLQEAKLGALTGAHGSLYAMHKSLAIAQLSFYGLALLGALGLLRSKLLKLPYYFSMINASLFVWIYYRLKGRQQASSHPGVVWT